MKGKVIAPSGPVATVREVDGKLVLDDPQAVAMIRAIAKHNCERTLDAHRDRIAHFVGRAKVLGRSVEDTVIVLLNVDDPIGGALAEALMPGTDWQPFRDRGEVPFARGLAGREGIVSALDTFDDEAAKTLREFAGPELAVVVVDYGVAVVSSGAHP